MIVNNLVNLNNPSQNYLNLKKIYRMIVSTRYGEPKKNLKNNNMDNCRNNYIINLKYMINMT